LSSGSKSTQSIDKDYVFIINVVAAFTQFLDDKEIVSGTRRQLPTTRVCLSALGWLIWIIFVGVVAKKAFDAAARSGTANLGGLGGSDDFAALLVQLEQSLRVAQGSGGLDSKGGAAQNLTPQQQLQIQAMLMKAQNQMQQMDALGRQRYDTKMADLAGMAASAGIDWRPDSF
jgi:hypothetical protein